MPYDFFQIIVRERQIYRHHDGKQENGNNFRIKSLEEFHSGSFSIA
jgi:hypothetical protein